MLFFMKLIEVMFFVGLAGSAVVIVISFVDDFAEIFSSDDELPAQGTRNRQPSHPPFETGSARSKRTSFNVGRFSTASSHRADVEDRVRSPVV